MKFPPPLFLTVAFLATAFTACNSCEKKNASAADSSSKNKILGRWEIRDGQRDGQPFSMFEGAWMEFSDSTMLSNLPLPDPNFVEIPMHYGLKKGILTQQPEGVPSLDLTVLELSDSVLTLDFELAATAFRIVFGRAGAVSQRDSTRVEPAIGN